MRITFELDGDDAAAFRKALATLLTTLVELNARYLLAHPRTPALYRSCVRYAPDPIERGKRIELWRTVPKVLEAGDGDCEDLASWRVAELLVRKRLAWPVFRWGYKNGDTHYHILVGRPGGHREDPSKILGMQGEY